LSNNKGSKLRNLDPHIEREKELYEYPLPSREFILKILNEQGVPVTELTLHGLLEITQEEKENFSRRLSAMMREGQIMCNRKGYIYVVEKLDLIKGKVQGHADGFGFLIPDDDSTDLFLSPKEMHKVLHGDIVMVRNVGTDRRGRREGTIVEVLERVIKQLVGRLHIEYGILSVEAENKRISQAILVPKEESMNAEAGQVVTVEIIQQPRKNAQPIGRIVEILGDYTAPGMEIEIALRKHDLPYKFTREVEKFSAKFSKEVLKKDLVGRENICHLPLVTIDGETARDFDDAVYCEREGTTGYRLYVAIADVSHYVRPNDVLDQEALNRGNSVYFPRRVIPMLPEALSNGLCSLNPQVERLCMVCEMTINIDGDF
jgi:ribonuclease R